MILWKNLREISSLRLASEFKSAANSIDEYGIPLVENLSSAGRALLPVALDSGQSARRTDEELCS